MKLVSSEFVFSSFYFNRVLLPVPYHISSSTPLLPARYHISLSTPSKKTTVKLIRRGDCCPKKFSTTVFMFWKINFGRVQEEKR